MITKYGYDVVAVAAVLSIVGSVAVWYFVEWRGLKLGLVGVFVLLLLFTLNFFRDPDRVTPTGDNLIIAPADGKVVLIKDVQEDDYLKGRAVQISIFMSPLNVHVNRYPLTGTVGYFKHINGEYLVAFEEKSSEWNERTLIGVERAGTKVLFKQIAGFVARRIVADINVGDKAVAGQRFGMIRFGSRVDVIVPRRSALKVHLGDKTVAGETVVAVVS
jgi:phosphatidylserine decarboxylase